MRRLTLAIVSLQFFTYSQMKLPAYDAFTKFASASGSGTYTVEETGQAQLDFRFTALIPNGQYVLTCFRTQLPPIRVNDASICSDGDWGNYSFRADAQGNGTLGFHVPSPLPESKEGVSTVLALSSQNRVHLLSVLPEQERIATPTATKNNTRARAGFIAFAILVAGGVAASWWLVKRRTQGDSVTP